MSFDALTVMGIIFTIGIFAFFVATCKGGCSTNR